MFDWKSKILFPMSRLCVHPLVSPSVRTCVRRLAPIPAGESQDVTNKSCSISLRDDPWGPWGPEKGTKFTLQTHF